MWGFVLRSDYEMWEGAVLLHGLLKKFQKSFLFLKWEKTLDFLENFYIIIGLV